MPNSGATAPPLSREAAGQSAHRVFGPNRILAAFRTPLNIGSHEVSVTASIGIAFDASGLVGDEILRNADLAMYAAKERGKDRYAEFEDEMRTAAGLRLEAKEVVRQHKT